MGMHEAPYDPSPAILLTLGQLDFYLDEHYHFRAQYKGFWRKPLAWYRAAREEMLEREKSGESEWKPPIVYGSCPHSFERIMQEYQARHEEYNFSKTLMNMIQAKGLDHVEVYKRARIDRKLFSKIKTNIDYIPGAKTILALVIGMELDVEETNELLRAAGFHISDRILADVIVEFFLIQRIYDLDTINLALYKYRQPPLG